MAALLSPGGPPAPPEFPGKVDPGSLRLRRRCLLGVGLALVGVSVAGTPAGHAEQIVYAQQHGKSKTAAPLHACILLDTRSPLPAGRCVASKTPLLWLCASLCSWADPAAAVGALRELLCFSAGLIVRSPALPGERWICAARSCCTARASCSRVRRQSAVLHAGSPAFTSDGGGGGPGGGGGGGAHAAETQLDRPLHGLTGRPRYPRAPQHWCPQSWCRVSSSTMAGKMQPSPPFRTVKAEERISDNIRGDRLEPDGHDPQRCRAASSPCIADCRQDLQQPHSMIAPQTCGHDPRPDGLWPQPLLPAPGAKHHTPSPAAGGPRGALLPADCPRLPWHCHCPL